MADIRNDAITILIEDHREAEQVFQELERPQGDPQHRRDLTDHVIAELVRHSVAEEQYLYPTVRKVLPDGDQLADREIGEHAEAERTMKDLDGMEPTDPRFAGLLSKLTREIRHHIRGEEAELFPRLRAMCSEADLIDLGQKIMAAKESAPTRPHPSAPDKPPLNKILDPGVGLVDRLRDALSSRNV